MKFSIEKFVIEGCFNLAPPGEGGGGGWSGGGGVNPPPQPPGQVPANLSELTSSGGLFGTNAILAVPTFDTSLNSECLSFFEFDNYNTEEDCFYKYRVEELKPGRSVTVKMVQIIYRNLGPCTVNIMIEGFDQDNNFMSINKDYKIGNTLNLNKLYELDAALELTIKRPQITITRKANQGPLSITRTTMIGEMGEGNIL